MRISFAPDQFLPALRRGGFRQPDYWTWCGSVIRGGDGLYHLFASRWPRTLPFHPGWLTNSEIVRAVSPTPEGPYELAEVVLPQRGPEYWDGDSTHNPHVVRIGDTYVLYYMGSSHPLAKVAADEKLTMDDPRVIVARSKKRIGIATAPDPRGPWTRRDQPILYPKPGSYYSYFTSNPAPLVNEDGSVLLMFKSRRYQPNRRHSDMMLGVARAAAFDRAYEVITPEPISGGPGKPALEDPFIWKSERGYEMIAKDMTGAYAGESGEGVRAVSADGVSWRLDDPPHSWSRRIAFDDGKSEMVGSAERPFILFDNGRPTHLFLSLSDGPGRFDQITRTWIQPIAFR